MTLCAFITHLKRSQLGVKCGDNKPSLSDLLINTSSRFIAQVVGTVRFPLVVLENEDADVLVCGVAETTVVVNKWLPLCSSSAAPVTLPAKPCIMAQALALSQQIPQLAVGFSLLKAHSSCLAVLQEFSLSDCRSNYASSRTPTPPGGYSPHSPIDRDVPMSPRRRYRSETTIKHSF